MRKPRRSTLLSLYNAKCDFHSIKHHTENNLKLQNIAMLLEPTVGQAYTTTFSMPSGIKLSQFNGSDWSNWLGILEALLTLHEAKDIFAAKLAPLGVDKTEWDSLRWRIKAYLYLYIKPDIFSLITSDAKFSTFNDKWDKLKQVYGSATGSTTIFNLWIQLIQACLDDSQPMSSQLAKLNKA
jgi:hypothetical protein